MRPRPPLGTGVVLHGLQERPRDNGTIMLATSALLVAKRYEVQTLIGQGGMGAVYRVRDRLSGELVALKRVALDRVAKREFSRAPQHAEPLPGSSTLSSPRALRIALAQEFRTLAALRHPNIVSVLDYGFDDAHLPFFTMEYLRDTQDLLTASLLLPLEEKLELIAQLLRALSYLHRHAILHRDLKPSNVLVYREAGALRLKVLDFGIAVAIGAENDAAGTRAYMAPEVESGEPPTPASDLYAVGVILYQMLTGAKAPEATRSAYLSDPTLASEPTARSLAAAPLVNLATPATTNDDRVTAAITVAVPPPNLVAQQLALQSEELLGPVVAFVARLLELTPQDRYQSATAVLQDLSALMNQIVGRPLAADERAARDSFLQAAELVGRDRELAQLETALVAAGQGAGAVILVGGESGAGKSRLLEELRTRALVRGVRTFRGQAVSDGGTAFQILSDLLPALVLELPIEDEEAAVLKELIPELPALLDRTIPSAVLLSPQAAQQRLHNILLTTLTRSTEPVLLLLEDLHWAAPESMELLKDLAALAPKLKLLIVASYRNDERAELPRLLPGAEELQLPRLTPQAVATLSSAMLGESGTNPELLAFLGREAEGNVYFIIESVRALAEEAGSLEAVGTRALPRQVISGGVASVVQRRLGRVPEWARPLLRAAAVAGRQLDLTVFRALASELDVWLQVCLDAAVLEVHDAQLRFSHDKLREGLLATLPVEERRRLHLQIAETVERVHGATDAYSVTLAFHYEQAADLPKAAHFTAQAGAAALRRGAIHESVALLERAKSLLEQSHAPLLQWTATLRRLARAYYGIGRLKDAVEICRAGNAALGRPVPTSAPRRWGALLREAGVEVKNRLWGVTPTTNETERVIAAEVVALNKGAAEAFFGKMDEALLVTLYSLHAAEQSGQIEPQINYLSRLGYAMYTLPLHRLGKLYLERADRLLGAHPQYTLRSEHYPFVAYLQGSEGNWPECIAAYSLWLDSLQAFQDEPLQCLALSSRSSALMACGRLTEALADCARGCARPAPCRRGSGWRRSRCGGANRSARAPWSCGSRR